MSVAQGIQQYVWQVRHTSTTPGLHLENHNVLALHLEVYLCVHYLQLI
jgi:hypothetical protein